jgi:hypothetical protein
MVIRNEYAINKQRESLKLFYQTTKGIAFKKRLSELASKNKPHLGHNHSPETIEKMRIAKLGKKMSLETRQKMSEAQMGEKHHMFGKHCSQEVKNRVSDGLRRLYQTAKGKKIREIVDNANKGNHHHLGHKHSEEALEKMRKIKTGKVLSEETKNKMRESQKVVWSKSIEYKNERVGNIVKGNKNTKYPNKKETIILNMLQELQPDTRYFIGGGDGLKVGGKIPDIYNGKDKLIEHYGYHWHHNHNPQDRIDLFAKYGFKTLIIQEMDLIKHPDKVREQLIAFINS